MQVSAIRRVRRSSLNGLNDVTTVDVSDQAAIKSNDDTLTKVSKLFATALNTINQQKIFNLQMKQAKQQLKQTGSFDLPTLQEQAAYQAQVKVGVTPETQKMMIYGGLGLLAVIFIASSRNRS